MNLNIVPDVDLLAKAQIKLNNLGIDENTVINRVLQKILEDDLTELEIVSLSEPTDKTKLSQEKSEKNNKLNDILQHVKDYFALLPKEEIEKRLKLAKTKGPTSESIGIFKGMIWMSDDFDEPLLEMKEYM
ncbi:MAG: DUF2281 domain-containing protein [Candidatus Cloacimonetes bacterium]|nr:DUF2281 domain-containing protein [Candidatus Cloacimonadota bacterium]